MCMNYGSGQSFGVSRSAGADVTVGLQMLSGGYRGASSPSRPSLPLTLLVTRL